MSTEFTPTRVPRGGPPGRLAIGVVVLGLAVVVAVGVVGGKVVPPWLVPSTPGPVAAASPTPTATPTHTYLGPTPHPDSTCRDGALTALSGPIPRHPRELAPTGLETVVSWGQQAYGIVADVNGQVWTSGAGRLARLDPATGATTVWTFTDDPAFDAGGMAAARGGGVWLFGGKQIRWFDGQRFVDVIDAPSDVYDLAEGPDGALWASSDQATLRWDGTSWSGVCDGGTSGGSYNVEVGSDGTVWTASSKSGAIARYDDLNGVWVIPIPGDGDRPGVNAMAVAPNGALWVVNGSGLQRFDRSWKTDFDSAVDLNGVSVIAASPDGSIWVAPGTDVGDPRAGSGVGVAHLIDGTTWETFGAADGLAGPGGSAVSVSSLTVSGDLVFAATSDGVFWWDSVRWERIGPEQSLAAQPWSQRLVVDPAGGMWSATDELWRYRGGTWTRAEINDVRDLARAADGTLAVATGSSVMVRSHGTWSTIDQADVFSVAIDGDGRVWAVSGEQGSLGSAWSFTRRGERWVRSPISLPPELTQVTSIAAGEDGTLWVRGGSDSIETFWRLSGGRWKRLPPLGSPGEPSWGKIIVAPGGDLLAAMSWQQGPGLVGRYHGSRWTILGGDRPEQFDDGHDLALDSDGTLWMATNGLAEVGQDDMTLYYPGHWFGSLAVGPDGKVYAAGPSGIYRLRSSLRP